MTETERLAPLLASRLQALCGDFRTGNLIVDQDGLRGVLDWELAHRGDPMHDLGWLCTTAWRFGSANPVGGFGARADLMAGYADGGGVPPDEATQRWWELFGTVRWAVLCRRQAARYLSGAEPSIEFAVLGRRVCEQEYDVLLAHARDHRARLADLGCADDAELCAAIRDGSLDHRFGDVIAAVRAMTVDKLTVANPGHLARPG